MKKQQIENLESYFKTENDHWNKHAFEMVCLVLQMGDFDNPELPLQLFNQAINFFTEHHRSPLKSFHLFESELDKVNLNSTQKIFICERIEKYLRYTEYDDLDLDPIRELIAGQMKKLKKENEPSDRILTKDLRESLKSLVEQEIKSLSKTLDQLEPIQRLNIVCRLVPFVLPKVDSVHHTDNEPRIQI